MQRRSDADLYGQQTPFSILNRIGGDATSWKSPLANGTSVLSVSSIGSEAMQPGITTSVRKARRTFSILNRIGGDATCGGPLQTTIHGHFLQYPQSDRRRCNLKWERYSRKETSILSVSSIGSEAMQLPRCPLRDRACHSLSVSSIGSEAMQPRCS